MAIDGPFKKHDIADGTCRLPDFLWGPLTRLICLTQDLRCALLQRIFVWKSSSLLSWFRICIHIVNPKCHLLKASKIEFTFSALSSAQLCTGHFKIKIKLFVLRWAFNAFMQCGSHRFFKNYLLFYAYWPILDKISSPEICDSRP